MSMKLAKDNTATPDFYSENGAGTDPIRAAVTLDGTGGVKTAVSTDPIYVIFSDDGQNIASITGHDDNPSGPLVELVSEETGINWELSADGTTWSGLNALTLADQDVSSGDTSVRIYARCNIANDGSVEVDNYVAAQFRTKCKQNPPA